MISYKTIDFRHLTKIADEQAGDAAEPDSMETTLGDLCLKDRDFERMTMYIGSMQLGSKVKIADVIYSTSPNMLQGKPAFYKVTPDFPHLHSEITLGMMIAEWAFCWYDAAPPILEEDTL
jgi:hypothetical protein